MKHLFTLFFLIIGLVLFGQEDSIDTDTTYYADYPPAPSRQGKFSINMLVGYGEAYHSISSEKYPELINCRGGHEKNISVRSAEVNVGYHIKHWWQVNVGVQYFETGFQFSESKALSDTLPSEFSNGCDVYGSVDPYRGYVRYAFYDPRFAGHIQGYHPSTAIQNVDIQYYYLGLPVRTTFIALLNTAHLGYLKLSVHGGLTPNYMIRQKYANSFENGDWKYVLQDSIGVPMQIIRRGNVSSTVGLGLTFLVRKNFEATLEFNRQDQLLDLFNWKLYGKFDYEEKHRVYRCVLSLSYFLE